MGRAVPGSVALAMALVALAPQLAGAAGEANDPALVNGSQWALTGAPASINAPPSWSVSTGAGVLIADVDTGADFGHPDLAGQLVPGVHFFADMLGNTHSDGNVADDNGHGTMTAGIMVANTNNGIGIAAVAPKARVLVIKALDRNGAGTSDTVGTGIRWAVDHGARVINLSVGSDVPALLSVLGGTQVQDAIRYAAQHDVAVAAAAGNSGTGLLSSNDYASVADVALVAGAVGREGHRAPYSADGNIYAPGGDASEGADVQHEVLSTIPGGYGYATGTSFAAPHVAGVLAQLIAGGATAAGARQKVLATSPVRYGLRELDASQTVGSSPSGTTGSGVSPLRPPAQTYRGGGAPAPGSALGRAAAGRASPGAAAAGVPGGGVAASGVVPLVGVQLAVTPAPSPSPGPSGGPASTSPGAATTPPLGGAVGSAIDRLGHSGAGWALAIVAGGVAIGAAGAGWLVRRRLVSRRRPSAP